MSTGTVFDLLYDLAKLDDTAIRTAVRRLLLLIPCDKGVQNAFDGLIASSPKSPQKSNSLDRKKLANSFDKIAGAGRSPKLSARFVKGHSPKPSKTDDFPSPSEPYDTPAERLKKLFDPKEPFRLLYNLEVLSSRLLPVTYNEESFESANRACRDFVSSNGVHVLTDLLRNDHLPPNLELGYRQEIFDRLLSILCYLLCGDSKLHDIVRSEKETDDRLKSEEETASDADTSRRTTSFGAAASSAAGNVGLSLANLEPPRSRLVTEIPVELYAAILASLQRFAWTAAAGMLSFSSQVELRSPNGSIQYAPSPRSRLSESSTGSGDSHDLQGAPTSVHSALLAGHTSPSQIDDDLTRAGLTLLIECILKRPADGPDEFFRLPFVNDFVLDLLLLTPSEQIRYWTEDQLLRMSFEATDGLVGRRLLDLLLKAHLPLWTTSSTVRGASRRLLEQCSEYFSLRSKLMESVPDEDLAALQPSPTQMLDDECNWLLNFNCSTDPRAADTDARLLAGHMQMIEALLKRVPERKAKVGQRLIHALVVEFLFPAAARISPDLQQQSLTPKSQRQARAADVRAKCQKSAGRLAAFRLLQELARGCKTNFSAIAHLLTSLHHESNPELGKQWDYAPLVDGAMDLGYIGLKNAGATCYMNSVLQQFFMEPGVAEYILSTELDDEDNVSRESVFVELQRVFGHLRESELEYYTPKSFWDVFRLWGQKVNPREQQDAFEFYTCLIDQIDTELKKHGREELFKKKYQGIFSDQKICHGCPHRYEREEPFYALNLPLRALGLEESLDQFVTGEILEGENAYLCEKCGQKRTTLKRMCVKSLPPVLTIQLKRFDYDWEEGRSLKFNDHFKFPRSLDMYPYTAQALSAIENVDDLFEMSSPSIPPNNSYGSGLGAGLQGSSLQVAGSPVTPGPFGGGGSNWSARLRRFSSSYGASFDEHSAKYDLVGMVVHSGQASAGHYYAYIKERREDASLNGNFNKWLKFNDTTVEEVEMTDHLLETECFGGRYTVKNDNKMSMYPEERERYWNAYLLIYEKADRTSKGGKSLRHRSSPYSAKRSISVNISGPTPPSNKQARRRDSLSELAALVEQGELTNLFKGGASIPPRLREEIRDENLKFARDRDLFNKDYFKFAAALVDGAIYSKDLDEESAADATKFAVHFCVNLAWHTRKTLRGDALAFSDRICTLLKHSRVACNWIFTEFGQEPGNKFIDDFLFNCDTADARYAFANILKAAFEHGALYLRTDTPQDVRPDRHADDLITHAISLIRKEAADRWAISDAFFGLLHSYAALGPAACQHLLNRGAFRALLGFLVTVPAKNVDGIEKMSRRWTHAQARDFGDVWCALALIITACDLQQFNNTKAVSAVAPPSGVASPERKKLLPSSSDVYDVVVGWMMPGFVKEIVWALANVPNTQDCLTDLVVHAAYGNVNFSRAFLSEALDALADFPSNELRRIFHVVAGLITRVDD
uniref:USP domain-containing protein n=1 Tax=Plectus sambesii TaxID=2011161 RepID=A0A914XB29_9BILA